ncbi:MAG: macro domain-containing protein [Chloroflexi bacterium]|nr:macro domain-containing protein [Chloroflexota bacterium]MDA1220031.1 macro domain-containing protein [Chloroflexota bacterium]
MITYVVCDLFSSPARVLVNTVNTVGVMGKGIAKDFKQIYPEMFEEYQELCEKGAFNIGNLWLYKTSNKWVLNFPTKKHWRQPSKPEYIEQGLKKFVGTYHVYGITSISFPLLGCGNGELDWETQVRPLMEQYLQDLPITVYIHLMFRGNPFMPEHKSVKEMRDWLRGEPESLAFNEVWDDLRSLLVDAVDIHCLGRKENFRASMNETKDEIIFGVGDSSITIPSEAFLDLWQQIRQSGFVTGDRLPFGLDSYASYVVSLMAKLTYIKPVEISSNYSTLSPCDVGLQLLPRTRASELPLLAGVGAVEPE